MRLYLGEGKNNDVIKLGDELKKVAKNEKDTDGYISSIYNRNALALGYLGFGDASLKDLKIALKYAKDIEDKNIQAYNSSQFYHEMGLQYDLKRFENKNARDSVVYTYTKSIEFAKQISDNSKSVTKDVKYDQIGFNYMRMGMFYIGGE
ncbi:hypothetical protein OF897_15155 [Chryseobacterium formosus]|uniref:Tetratricopeptide repeat protein n=1 Tax=Chryseobacterium formosus TaxID=1537363 RepID=A0ABT3XUB6_9FLAO|nr:hypothetical protein [Chryseobacterium formosus]MCX8525257.1 hypothetical protein [Chryseobacterium formosus]